MQTVNFSFTFVSVMAPGIPKVLAFLESQERSQAWLARQVGTSATFLSFVLTAKKPCPKPLGKKLSKVTGIPARDFAEVA